MSGKTLGWKTKFKGIFLFFFFLIILESASLKVKVIVDNATLKETPEIGGKTIARVPLNTVLEAEKKQGEWYKVSVDKQGTLISGFIHEMLVEVVKEEAFKEQKAMTPQRTGKSQAEIVAEIEIKMEENKKLIRQEEDFDKALRSLRPLVAKAFNIEDNKKQKELAAEIFLWTGLAYAGKGDELSALREFNYMFEVDHAYAREITRNIFNPKIVGLIQQAEKEFLGIITEYSIDISTEPKEARIKINGKEIGFSPEVYRTATPKVAVEIEKEGYKPIKEEIFLSQEITKKKYTLERLGRNVEVRSNPPGARVYLDGKDTKKETNCVLSFIPFGVHKLRIIKDNYTSWEEEIKVEKGNSPFVIEALLSAKKYGYFEKWGGLGNLLFQQPTGIALDNENNVYIIDASQAKIKKFTPAGKLLTGWNPGNKGFRKIKSPGGIAVDREGYLYVTDSKKNCVLKFDKLGKLVRKWGKEGNKEEEFRTPLGIVVDHENNIYIVDSGNNRIKKYSHLGIVKKIWGRKGTSAGDFVYPTAVALGQRGEVLVLDRIRIQIFSPEGEFISSWGRAGSADGEFNRPMGICVDQDNYVYVADSGNNRIQKFDKNGQFISKWGSFGAKDGQMNFPAGVAVNGRGEVFVVDRDNNRVQTFRAVSNSEPESRENNIDYFLIKVPFSIL